MKSIQVCTLINLLLAVLKLFPCRGYLLNDGDTLSSVCFPQDKHCSCFGYQEYFGVKCIAKNLTQFPNFTKISDQVFGHYKVFDIELTDNELTLIPSGGFLNFDRANKNRNSIYLDLERNKISIIENDAFVGINEMDIGINLTDNCIAALPFAFQMLHNLTILAISGNPILAFDSATVNSIAKTLDYLEIDYDSLVLGNKKLSVLNITILAIYDVPADYGSLSFNPFLFFKNTMENLLIATTELKTLPCSLIDEPKMKYFHIQHANNISANMVFDCRPCTSLNVFELNIMFSGLDEFPDILYLMPSLLSLNLFYNEISSVNEKFIPSHNKVQVLNLSYNRLRTIPAIFNRFDNLKFLYIECNDITSVAPESNILSIQSLCAAGSLWLYNYSNCNHKYDHMYNLIDNTTIIG